MAGCKCVQAGLGCGWAAGGVWAPAASLQIAAAFHGQPRARAQRSSSPWPSAAAAAVVP